MGPMAHATLELNMVVFKCATRYFLIKFVL